MYTPRTDLAVEAKQLYSRSTKSTSALEGVKAEDTVLAGCPVTTIDILDNKGQQALGKPRGSYITISLPCHDSCPDASPAQALQQALKGLLNTDENAPVLIAALGNESITPDALGPLTAKRILATRHLIRHLPEHFGQLRPVSVIAAGVLGSTGMEAAELIAAACGHIHPTMLIAVDALASMDMSRLCSTIQISSAGIVPGSGVGNNRSALNRETLGVPVIAIGVPTVVDAAVLTAQLAADSGYHNISADQIRKHSESMIVTPRDIDKQVRTAADTVARGLNLALQSQLSPEELELLLN